MPGYLSNRYIKFDPSSDIKIVKTTVLDLNVRLTEAESNIDDISLNIGV